MRFEPDGQLSYPHWDRSLGPETGTWTVKGEPTLFTACPKSLLQAVLSGERIKLFDRDGVVQIDAIAQPH
jgi:hypothetical protein